MATLNTFKGGYTYGQVSPLEMEDQLQKSPPQKRSLLTKSIAATAIFILIIIAITLAAVCGTSKSTHTSDPQQPHNLNSADSIRLVCNVTQHPTTCFSTISSIKTSPSTDPEQILNLSIRVCFNQVITVATFLNNSNSNSDAAISQCSELYEDARGSIGDAMEAMEPGLTESKVNDVQTWLSAALTDQETCLDGLEEMGDSVKVKVDELKVKADKLKEYLSNSLAIVANLDILLKKFGMKLH